MIVCGELIVYQEDIECPFFTQKTGIEFLSIPESVHPKVYHKWIFYFSNLNLPTES